MTSTSATRQALLKRVGAGAEPRGQKEEMSARPAPKLKLSTKGVAVLTQERKKRIVTAARDSKSKRKVFPVISID